MKKAIAFLIAIGVSFLNALYLKVMWSWFIVPLGVVNIGYWHAMGLGLLFGSFSRRSNKTFSDDYELISYAITAGIVSSLLFAMAAIIHAFMV